MGRKNPKFIITLQPKNGSNPPVAFEITKAKANKIIDLIQPEIAKKRKELQCTSGTLEPFFKEDN